jgi:hypothetical protein
MEKRPLKELSAPEAKPMPIIFTQILGIQLRRFIPNNITEPATNNTTFLPQTSLKPNRIKQIKVVSVRTKTFKESL